MEIIVKLTSEHGQEEIEIDNHPDTCPVCLRGIDPRMKFGYTAPGRSEIVYQCPRQECRHLFIGYYSSSVFQGKILKTHHLRYLVPQTVHNREFSEYITSASVDFVKIFNQAHRAEELGMSDVAGPGYRKALEFLIKDYSTFSNPEAIEAIRQKQLSTVINEYVTDSKIRATAKRAAWLGNDETHYYRKWADKDMEDLKILIELTVRWIESELLTRQYEKSMDG
jgi:hypothetical protein